MYCSLLLQFSSPCFPLFDKRIGENGDCKDMEADELKSEVLSGGVVHSRYFRNGSRLYGDRG